jgi:hypothetical protein
LSTDDLSKKANGTTFLQHFQPHEGSPISENEGMVSRPALSDGNKIQMKHDDDKDQTNTVSLQEAWLWGDVTKSSPKDLSGSYTGYYLFPKLIYCQCCHVVNNIQKIKVGDSDFNHYI